MLYRVRGVLALLFFAASSSPFGQAQSGKELDAESDIVSIDANATTTSFPHFWEKTFGSGRAVLSLRESYRDDLRSVKEITDFEEVRFHGIFMDEVGLFDPDAHTQNPGQAAVAVQPGTSIYNFSYIDQIYDGLLANHVRPFVELSFMPKKMASDPNALHPFWYKPNVSPPNDYAAWDAMISAFVQHLIERYGIAEVSKWKFEVWNEPNLDFWGGKPKQSTFFELYDHTATAIKKVNDKLLVGGPSTAQAAWVPAFLAHCKEKNIPVDFVSSHVYANDRATDVFATNEDIPRDRMVCRSVRKVHDEIAASALPSLPLIFSEYNASYANEPDVTDTTYMGPWMAATISQCDGLTEAMSYWTFSDVFEEQGVVKTPFYGGFGLIAEDGIRKPAYNAFAMLHKLGDRRIATDSDSVLVTKREDGSLVMAAWNYVAPYGTGATYTPTPATLPAAKTIKLRLAGVRPRAAVEVWRVDADHGNVMKSYDAMGRPAFPSREQIAQLRAAGIAAPPERRTLDGGVLTLTIPAQGLVVVSVSH